MKISFVLLASTWAAASGFAGSHAVGPDYQRPSVAAPAAWRDAGDATTWKLAAPAAALPRGEWWKLFGDSALDDLESRALQANQDLAAAAARVEQARAAAGLARSAYFPSVAVDSSVSRGRTSGTTDNIFPNQETTNYSGSLEVSWELDFFGRVRRLNESARAGAAASAADFENLRLALSAEVASDYFSLRALDRESSLVADGVELRRKELELVQSRQTNGAATNFDVARAETELASTEAEVAALANRRAALQNALAVLLGEAAPDFNLSTLNPQLSTDTPPNRDEWRASSADASRTASTSQRDSSQPSTSDSYAAESRRMAREFGGRIPGAEHGATGQLSTPPAVPAGLPSDLLERRPDIAAAEAQLAAANARIGVARAAFFPAISLTGSAGFASGDVDRLFNADSRSWAIGPSLYLPIFQGGRNRANLQRSRAAFEESVAQFRQRVLVAFREVQDALTGAQLLSTQAAAQDRALAAARRAGTLAQTRYDAGYSNYFEVIDAQRTVLANERVSTQLSAQRLLNSVALVKALGGGWTRTPAVGSSN